MTNPPWTACPFRGDDCRLLYDTAVNAVLIGSPMTLSAAVSWVRPRLRTPIFTWEPDPLREPLIPNAGTLLIRAVASLTSLQQRYLLEYLRRPARSIRVISLSTSPVYPRVLRGDFIEALYYRLNVLCLQAGRRADVSTVH